MTTRASVVPGPALMSNGSVASQIFLIGIMAAGPAAAPDSPVRISTGYLMATVPLGLGSEAEYTIHWVSRCWPAAGVAALVIGIGTNAGVSLRASS